MSNTVITNYTDLNGPSTKADSSVVVIVNKDGSLSVDQKLLGTLMGTDGSQGAGISVVRVGHEGKPDDATDSETEDDKLQHVTLSVDSYYDEPNSIIKYDSGAEMLQSLRIETRENSLVGFQNDHCYTPLTSPSQALPQRTDSYAPYDEPVIEISHTPPPKPVPNSKKITILEQKIIPKGKKIVIPPNDSPVIMKGNDILNKPLHVLSKSKEQRKPETSQKDESVESSSTSSSGDSIPDRDSDSDYKDRKDKPGFVKVRKTKLKPRILKPTQPAKLARADGKIVSKLKPNKNMLKREMKERIKNIIGEKKEADIDLETILPTSKISTNNTTTADISKTVLKPSPKPVKKEKKTPAHVTALLSDMTSLFTSPDVIRRVSTDNKIPGKTDKDSLPTEKPQPPKSLEVNSEKIDTILNSPEAVEKGKVVPPKTYMKLKERTPTEKATKGFDLIPQLDDASLAQLLQDTTAVPPSTMKTQPTISTSTTMNSPGLAGPLSPTLDLLGGLQPEEEGLTEDLLMHVAQLVESSENLQEVIDKQVLGKVDTSVAKTPTQSPFQTASNLYTQTLAKTMKTPAPRKDPIEIVRRDGRVITLPPIEAPATRSSKRKTQMESPQVAEVPAAPPPAQINVPLATTPEPQVQAVSKQYVNKKLTNKKQEQIVHNLFEDKTAESQESWNSEDDPNRLWCICKQPHNNRFMICCDACEDWFHGKCVNITKAMGQQMEEQGIEWRCPNCIKKMKTATKSATKTPIPKKIETEEVVQGTLTPAAKESTGKTSCIVCKKAARASSIYCGDACILRHAQDSLAKPDDKLGKPHDKNKSDSRVIVYERKSGRLLAGPNAPTAENLKSWLQRNPTFEVVRPGTLSTLKPNSSKKKNTNEPNRIQTTLNFERIPRKTVDIPTPVKTPQTEVKEKMSKVSPSPKEELAKPSVQPKTPVATKTLVLPKTPATPKTPVTPKTQPAYITDTPRPSTSTAKVNEPRKIIPRAGTSRSQSYEKAPAVSPSTSRKKDPPEPRGKMRSGDPIRENVRKALHEQITQRMSEQPGPKFTDDEIQQFAIDTEYELHELFRDVGMKYKAKYRSLMFNIKDRKNLSLWEKICTKEITPRQLVRLSPEELASQELAQWRDKEAKHQLELIKKSELDLLAASKTYVLKTHKGEEVMEPKKPVTTDLDPNMPVENLVKALNAGDEAPKQGVSEDASKDSPEKKHGSNKKRDRDESGSRRKIRRKDSKRDSEGKKSRASRRRSEMKDRDLKDEDRRRSTRKSDRKSQRVRSASKERSRSSKEKSGSRSRVRSRSRSRAKTRSRSRSRSRPQVEPARRISSRRSRSKHTRTSTDEKPTARSRSQDNVYTKTKHDSTDSDSVERPKSAMLKEVHPEYDPHEPMITSAFSEEDLRKSREDVFEDSYKHEVADYGTEYDPTKAFLIDTNTELPSTKITASKQDKTSEAESDQEPTSTVDNSAPIVWNGCINMVDVARFYVAAHEVSGSAVDLEEDLSTELDIVGRINPDTVWDYINKMKKSSNKDIVILRLQAANDEEKMQYIALYSYLSSRNRLGVVKVASTAAVKDFYVVPLASRAALPAELKPLRGPGLPERATHLLLAIVIRQRRKRAPPHIPKHINSAKVARESRKRSFTPPVVPSGAPAPGTPPASPKRRALPLPAYTSPALSTSVKDKIAASLAGANDDDEAYSPGSPSSGDSGTPVPSTLRTKMEELNRQIEEQKQQILKMAQADSSVGEDEAYSPSRPMTPPEPVVPLADIALPSNLQEILATIKQRSENATTDVDMRTMPLP